MGEDQCRFDEGADFAGAGGGVLQGAPALGEESEAAFSAAARRSQQQVVGPVVDGQGLAVGGLLDRGVHAVACAFVAGVGQGRQVEVRGRPVQGAEHIVVVGDGQVV